MRGRYSECDRCGYEERVIGSGEDLDPKGKWPMKGWAFVLMTQGEEWLNGKRDLCPTCLAHIFGSEGSREGGSMRSEQDVEAQMDAAADVVEKGRSNVPGMTYEQGVDAALRWVLEWEDTPPMEG